MLDLRPKVHPEHPWIDTTSAPLYVLTYPEGSGQEGYLDELQAMYDAIVHWLHNTPAVHATISDLRVLQSSARGRAIAADYYKRVLDLSPLYLACRAYVIAKSSQQTIMTAVYWQTPSDVPREFFSSIEDAKAWCAQLVRNFRPRRS